MRKGTGKSKGKSKSGGKQRGHCFECGGPHLARECPSKGKGKCGKGGATGTNGKGKAGWQYLYSRTDWHGLYPGPSPSTRSSWYPGTKGKGKGGKGGGAAMVQQQFSFPPIGSVSPYAAGSNEGLEVDESGWDLA